MSGQSGDTTVQIMDIGTAVSKAIFTGAEIAAQAAGAELGPAAGVANALALALGAGAASGGTASSFGQAVFAGALGEFAGSAAASVMSATLLPAVFPIAMSGFAALGGILAGEYLWDHAGEIAQAYGQSELDNAQAQSEATQAIDQAIANAASFVGQGLEQAAESAVQTFGNTVPTASQVASWLNGLASSAVGGASDLLGAAQNALSSAATAIGNFLGPAPAVDPTTGWPLDPQTGLPFDPFAPGGTPVFTPQPPGAGSPYEPGGGYIPAMLGPFAQGHLDPLVIDVAGTGLIDTFAQSRPVLENPAGDSLIPPSERRPCVPRSPAMPARRMQSAAGFGGRRADPARTQGRAASRRADLRSGGCGIPVCVPVPSGTGISRACSRH